MHQTTVRFSPDLWDDLAVEAQAQGTSVAQFLREAAYARLAFRRAKRGDLGWQAALEAAGQTRFEQEQDSARALAAQSRQATSQTKRLKQQGAGTRAAIRQRRSDSA